MEGTEFGIDLRFGNALDAVFVFKAIANEIGNGAHLQAMGLGKLLKVGAACHGAVFIENLDDHRSRRAARQARQVTAGLGVSGAGQHATGLRHQREDMPRLDQVFGTGIGLDGGAHGLGAIVRGNAGGHPFGRLDRHREIGRERTGVVVDHERQAQRPALFLAQGQADQAPAETGHEVDVFWAHGVGRHDQIAFVLTVFIIHEDDHATGLELFDQLGRRVEGRCGGCGCVHSGFRAVIRRSR